MSNVRMRPRSIDPSLTISVKRMPPDASKMPELLSMGTSMYDLHSGEGEGLLLFMKPIANAKTMVGRMRRRKVRL